MFVAFCTIPTSFEHNRQVEHSRQVMEPRSVRCRLSYLLAMVIKQFRLSRPPRMTCVPFKKAQSSEQTLICPLRQCHLQSWNPCLIKPRLRLSTYARMHNTTHLHTHAHAYPYAHTHTYKHARTHTHTKHTRAHPHPHQHTCWPPRPCPLATLEAMSMPSPGRPAIPTLCMS